MLPKFEYADFHKFLVSVGALLIAAGLAVPIFLLQEKTVAGTPEKTIKELTPIGKEIFSAQQEQIRWLLYWWPGISAGLGSIGFFFLVCGSYKWWRRQQHLERREAAELRKIDAEGRKLDEEVSQLVAAKQESPEEAKESIEKKAEEVVSEMSIPEHNDAAKGQHAIVTLPDGRAINLARDARLSVSAIYAQIEEMAAALVARLTEGDGEVFRNIRIRGAARADIISIGARLNIGVDVKLITIPGWTNNFRNRITEAISFCLEIQNLSVEEFGRRLRPFIIYVIRPSEDAAVKPEILDHLAQRVVAGFEPHFRTFEESPLFFIVELKKLQALASAPESELKLIENWAKDPRSFVLTASSKRGYMSALPGSMPRGK